MQSHFSAGELLKRRQPDPGALKAEGPDVALGRVFILAGGKINAFFRAELNSGT